MKPKKVAVFMLVLATAMAFNSTLFGHSRGQRSVHTSGIGVRGTFWDMDASPSLVRISNSLSRAAVDVGNSGGYIYFFSRMSDYGFMEFSIGAVGRVVAESYTVKGRRVEVTGVMPILLGFRYNLLPPESPSALQPYFSFGGGPYILGEVQVVESYFGIEEEVTVNSTLKAGGYAGAGINFLLASWFALNFDAKYHFVEFNRNHPYSGLEWGLGVSIMWGRYRPGR